MKILITGIAGFIGSKTALELAKDKKNIVVGIDNFYENYSIKLKKDNIRNLNAKIYNCDIQDSNKIEEIFRKYHFDVVIHLASMTGVRKSIDNPELYESVNVYGTENILKLTRKYKSKKLIFSSSSSIYGNQTKLPFLEEDVPTKILSTYGSTKREAELFCRAYPDLQIVCLRLFTVYGPHQRPDMAFSKFFSKIINNEPIGIYGDLDMKRDFTYIDNVVKSIINSIKLKNAFEIINVCNSQPISLKEVINLIEKIVGKKAKIILTKPNKTEMKVTHGDNSKGIRLLNYKNSVKIKEGLKKQYMWFLEQKERLSKLD